MARRGVPFLGGYSSLNVKTGKRLNKKGQWQNYLLPAIMALLVLGISFYFIFNEFFTGESMDREVCKESIMVRGAMPELAAIGTSPVDLKEEFPLKCKTNVIEVTEKDIVDEKIDKIIGDALAECWFIFGSGDVDVFPADFLGDRTTCLPCARIHLTEKAKEAVKNDKTLNGLIDIEGAIRDPLLFDLGGKKTAYENYLKGVGKLFEPFNPAFNNAFNLSGSKFEIGEWTAKNSIKKVKDGSIISMSGEFADVSLPKYLNVSQGDLIIVLGEVTDSGEDPVANYIPYMFYFQNGQPDYPEQMNKPRFFSGGFDDKICNAWEGIPA